MAEVSDLEIVDASNTARFPEGMSPAAVNNGARALEGMIARWYEDTDGSITSGGSANAYTVTSKRTIAALTNNTVQAFTSNFANTGAATLAFNGLTAKNIKRPNGDALVANDIVSGQVCIVIYKSSPDEWRLLSPGAFGASDSIVGAMAFATQTLMEAAASVATAVTPGRQHFHPGHPKAWGRVGSDGTLVSGSYNITSSVRNSTGNYTITIANDLADTNYAVICSPHTTTGSRQVYAHTPAAAGSFTVVAFNSGNADSVDLAFSFVVFGDMA